MDHRLLLFTGVVIVCCGAVFGGSDVNSPGELNIFGIIINEPNEPNLTSISSIELNEPNFSVIETISDIPAAAPVEAEAAVIPATAFDPNDPNTLPPIKPDVLPGEEDIKIDGASRITIARASELPELKYRLLPAGFDLKEGDAAELYAKAVQALPDKFDSKKIDQWLESETVRLDSSEVNTLLDSVGESLKLINEAGYLTECNWNKQKIVSDQIKFHKALKKLTQITALKARNQIADKDFEGAAVTIRKGLAMSRHIADCDNMLQGVLAVSTASIMLEQIEAFVQADGSPCLFIPLQNLPRPLIDLKAVVQSEDAKNREESVNEGLGPWDGNYYYTGTLMGYGDFQEEKAKLEYEQKYKSSTVNSLMNRLDRMVCALQCVEGIRYYHASYGKLPASLSDIRELQLPEDPVTGQSFYYRLMKNKAVLQSPVTESKAVGKQIIKYEIVIK